MAQDEIKPQRRTLGTWIREMVGKSEPLDQLYTTFSGWVGINAKLTFDYSKVTYSLTRALFYASKVTDRKTGKSYGGKYLYGAVFAKPIVNATAAFVIGQTPTVKTDDSGDSENEIESLINEWLSDNDGKMYKWVRDGMRDADAYLRVNKDLTLDRIAPELVTKIVDGTTGKLTGYDIEWTVPDSTDKSKKVTIREEYRTTAPFYRKLQIASDGKTETVLATEGSADGEDKDTEARMLPIVHLANEQEANEIYGNSDYQNVYLLMATYHEVFNAWVKNNIFNNNSMPVIEGVENVSEFMKNHGKKGKDGKTRVSWNSDAVMVIGKGGSAKFLQTDIGVAASSEKLIDKLFTLIAVASETPEYFLGKEMTSSRASTKEQLMIMIKKADRKQKEFTPFMNDLIDVVFDLMQRTSVIKAAPKYKFVWGQILDDDLELNLKIIDTLKKEGIITDRTAATLAGIGKIVDDIDTEIADAREENITKNEELFTQTPAVIQKQLDRMKNQNPEDTDPNSNDNLPPKPIKEMDEGKKKKKPKKD